VFPAAIGRKDVLSKSIVIFLIAFAVYFTALLNDFVYDDKAQVLENPWIKDIRNIPASFSKSVWSFRPGMVSNYYRPMMHIVYMMNYHIFGLRPWGFHLVNIVFHAGVSVIVFLVVSRLLGRSEKGGSIPLLSDELSTVRHSLFTFHDSRSFAFVAALLFATHPIHTEAVTWIAGLPDLACAFFYLFSFYSYMRWEEGLRSGYVVSVISFFFAAISKEPALTLPVMLIAYDYFFKKERPKSPRFFWRYTPYLIAGGVYLLLRWHALKGFAPDVAYEGLSSYQYAINVFPLFLEYLKDLFFPFNLNFWHAFHPSESLLQTEVMLSVSVALIFAAGIFLAWKKNKTLFLGLLFLLLPLIPAFYIKGIVGKPYAERYLYLPSFGFVLLLASFLIWVQVKRPGYILVIMLGAISLGGLYSIHTVQRNSIWKNDLILFSDTVKRSPDSAPPRRLLGNALLDMGRVDEAIEQYQIALILDAKSVTAHKNLGLAFMKKGMTREAITEYQKALTIDPNDAEVHRDLGNVYAKSGMTDEAIEQYRLQLIMDPNSPETYTGLGMVLARKGMVREAIAEYQKALAIDPNYVDAHYNLGSAYANTGQTDKAIEHFRAAVELRPNDAFYHNVLGIAYGQKGFFEKAIEEFNTAIQIAPQEPAYRKNLEKAQGMEILPARKR